jgi:predicted aldo/keto reductase-like oxidoreductase
MENIRVASEARPNSLSVKELALIDRVTDTYKKMLKIDCTACAYCMPCPQGVNIPQNFRLYNELTMFQDPEITFARYNRFLTPEQRAGNCAECGECEERCPQHIKIMEELKKVHPTLAR